jgi:hypothetical protein
MVCLQSRPRHRLDHVLDGMELLWARQQQMRHGQRAGFAIGARGSVLNALKVADMGETQDAADHLASAKAEHIRK